MNDPGENLTRLVGLLQGKLASRGYWSGMAGVLGDPSLGAPICIGTGRVDIVFGLLVAPTVPLHIPAAPLIELLGELDPVKLERLAEAMTERIASTMPPSSPYEWWLSPIGRN